MRRRRGGSVGFRAGAAREQDGTTVWDCCFLSGDDRGSPIHRGTLLQQQVWAARYTLSATDRYVARGRFSECTFVDESVKSVNCAEIVPLDSGLSAAGRAVQRLAAANVETKFWTSCRMGALRQVRAARLHSPLLQLVYDGSSGMGVHRQLGTALTQYSRCRVFTNGHRSSVPDYLGGWSTGRCGQPVYQRMMMTATGARRARCWNQSRSPAKVTVRQQRPHRRKRMWPVQPGRWRWTRWSLQWRLGQQLKPRNLFLGEDAQSLFLRIRFRR